MKHFLSIEIGGTKFQAVIGNSAGKIIDTYRSSVDRKRGAVSIREEIEKSIQYFKKYKPVSIGVGFGGPIDNEKGIICKSHHVKGWDNFPIGPWLKKISGLPVKVDNDANTAGLAEAIVGGGKGIRRVFYVCIGSGMGGGMIQDGYIYHGEIPGEAEIGLMPFDRKGNNMESQCCGWAMDRKIREYSKKNPKSILARLTKNMNGGEAKHLIPAIKKGDKGAVRILDEIADNIAFALSFAVHLFHPKIIIIGGGLSLTGEPLFSRINKILPRYIAHAFLPAPKVKIAKLGEEVVCVGGLILAKQAENEK
jgi:glucokinase